jgi:hypothetical protein
MTDYELRGLVLKAFYDRREDDTPSSPSSQWIDEAASDESIYRICKQLSENGYLEWHLDYEDASGTITAAGCDIFEDHRKPLIAIELVQSHATNVSNSDNVIIGNNNTQQIGAAFDSLLHAIDACPGNSNAKEESKNLHVQLARCCVSPGSSAEQHREPLLR